MEKKKYSTAWDEELIDDLLSLPHYKEWTRDEMREYLYHYRKAWENAGKRKHVPKERADD